LASPVVPVPGAVVPVEPLVASGVGGELTVAVVTLEVPVTVSSISY